MSAMRASELAVNVLRPGEAELLSAPPRLAQAKHLTFGADGRSVLRDEALSGAIFGYLEDMLRPYGVPFDEARFVTGNQNSFAFLSERCVSAMRGTREPDLIVLAHATADCEPNRSVSGYLSTLFRGEPLCFAISDHGELSPFTALRVMRGFGVQGACRRSLVLILDQSTRPYPHGTEPDRGSGGGTDHVLGLLFVSGPGPAGRPLAAVWQRSGVTPDRLAQTLAEVVHELSIADLRSGDVTVIAEGHIRAADLPPLLRESRERWRDSRGGRQLGQAPSVPGCVAPWAALASLSSVRPEEGSPDSGSAGGPVLVIGYDRSLAGLGVALFDPVTPGPVAEIHPCEAAA